MHSLVECTSAAGENEYYPMPDQFYRPRYSIHCTYKLYTFPSDFFLVAQNVNLQYFAQVSSTTRKHTSVNLPTLFAL